MYQGGYPHYGQALAVHGTSVSRPGRAAIGPWLMNSRRCSPPDVIGFSGPARGVHRDEVARFFTGLDLIEPGLVQVRQWRPDRGDSAPEGVFSNHGAVGRKPGG